jgi:adenylosuccinate lyase
VAQQLHEVLAGLDVRADRMARNLDLGGGVVYSQRALLALVESGLAREQAYRIVQSAALRALDGDGGFRANLEADAEVRSRLGDRLDEIFDPADFLRHVDLAFDRLNLGVTVT